MLSYEESLKILKETRALIEGHFILSSGLHSSKYVQCAQLLSKPNKAAVICNSLAEKIKSSIGEFNLILSPAMGGVIIGYEIGRILNKETIFSERVDGVFKLRRDFNIKKNSKVLIVEDVITTGKSSFKNFDLILSPAMGGIVIGYEIGRILNKETIFSERVNGNFKLRRDFVIKKDTKVLIVEDVITTGKSSLECSKLVDEANGTIVGYACIIDRSNGKTDIKNKIISQIELNIPTYSKDNLPESLLNIKPTKPGSRNL